MYKPDYLPTKKDKIRLYGLLWGMGICGIVCLVCFILIGNDLMSLHLERCAKGAKPYDWVIQDEQIFNTNCKALQIK